MPQPVAPGGRRRAKEPVARPDARAVQSGDHQNHNGSMGMPNGCGQIACRPGCVLIDCHVAAAGARLEARGQLSEDCHQALIRDHDAHSGGIAQFGGFFGVGQQQARRGIFYPQADTVRPEQGEQRHGNRATLHSAEQRRVEGQGRFQHDRDTIALADAVRHQPIRKLRGQH